MAVSGQDGLGLFGYVNGGTIKNLKTVDMFSGGSNSSAWRPSSTGNVATNYISKVSNSLFATYFVNGAKLIDVQLGLHSSQASSARLLCHAATSDVTFTRAYISVSGARISQNGYAIFDENCKAQFNEVYVVYAGALSFYGQQSNSTAFVTKLADNTNTVAKWQGPALDCATVNDVTRDYSIALYVPNGYHYNFLNYTATTKTDGTVYNNSTNIYCKNVITTGIKRYTSTTEMGNNWTNYAVGDPLRNDFSNWDTSVWTISSKGVPSMHVMTKA